MTTAAIPLAASVLPAYAELFCLSNFTFLHGASHAEELVERAVELGYSGLAVTDECSLAGVVRAHVAVKKAVEKQAEPDEEKQFKLLIGTYFKLTAPDAAVDTPPLTLIAIAQNREGYGNLSELITLARSRTIKGNYLLTPDDLAAPPAGYEHLRGLPDCLLILVPDYAVPLDTLVAQAAWTASVFSERAWMGLTLLYQTMDGLHRDRLTAVASHYRLPVVATGHVCMHKRSRKPLQDTLTAIRLGKPIAECGYGLAPNAEQHLRSRVRLANIYPAQALAETVKIAGKCEFSLDELRYEYPDELVPPGYTPARYLRQEVEKGMLWRFGTDPGDKIIKRIEEELTLINDLAYEAFFLTVYDLVKFARSKDILCQGRGSAANSVVCFCLGVTEVDPNSSTLLFARFLSKERGEPPDIDVDFEHQRRDEVIAYIYQKYGRSRAALAAAVHTYRPRGALREVGKALGVDLAIVDAVAKSQRWFDSKNDLLDRFAESGLDPASPVAELWAGLVTQLVRFPRHLSQHSGGFVISRHKLSRLVPIENAAMENRYVIEWDKDDLESLKLLKVDVLALGMLSALRRALDMMAQFPGKPQRLEEVPREDPVTYDMICKADTIGVFQIESRAQMSMLPRLRPRKFYDLVIQVAIVRPGPIQGGMVHPYLRRRQGKEKIEIHKNPAMVEALDRTLGIPIFQEQVMQIAMLAADFTAGEADELRRSMAAWKKKGGLEHYESRIVQTMIKNGYEEVFAKAIFEQMKGFGDYGFPESHSASFAKLAYISSWIKCHEPAIFLCSLLNSQPMGFYSPSQLVQDAKRHQVKVLPIDITSSHWDSSLEADDAVNPFTGTAQPAVRLGMSLLRGMSAEAAKRIGDARAIQAFTDLTDLARRAQLGRQELEALATGNALQALAGHRREALWNAVGAVPDKDLLRPTTISEQMPRLNAPSEAQEIVSDYRSMGLTLNRHPVALLRPSLLEKRFLPAEMLNTFQNGQFARGCGIVTVRQRPGTAKGVIFITIEDETGPVNVIIWAALLEKQRREVLNAPLLGVYGIWQCEAEVRHLVAKRLVDMSHLLGNLATGSRDFC
ncbi:error-prone DNA polymerase [Undibacterium terreum]|uniref:Error-prone DNA polymerase n=1 Tax=Undibacterium terreum TaxID=1224302 RepID=A0A916U477_9BURK|nr:error-prone DNA polymerase [Undibacterium terreum]GGC58231.1 error-prone DNA polymerase [Undibacterium terreum]